MGAEVKSTEDLEYDEARFGFLHTNLYYYCDDFDELLKVRCKLQSFATILELVYECPDQFCPKRFFMQYQLKEHVATHQDRILPIEDKFEYLDRTRIRYNRIRSCLNEKDDKTGRRYPTVPTDMLVAKINKARECYEEVNAFEEVLKQDGQRKLSLKDKILERRHNKAIVATGSDSNLKVKFQLEKSSDEDSGSETESTVFSDDCGSDSTFGKYKAKDNNSTISLREKSYVRAPTFDFRGLKPKKNKPPRDQKEPSKDSNPEVPYRSSIAMYDSTSNLPKMPIKRNPIFGVMPPIKSTAEQWASKLMATHSQPKPQPPSVEDDSKPLYYIRGDAASEHARYMQRYQSNSRKTFDHNKLQEILAKNGIPNPNMSRPPAKSATKRPMQDDSSEEEVYIPRSKRQQQVNLIPDPHPEQQSMQEVEMAYRPQTPPPSQTSSRPCKTYDINKSDSIFRTGMVVDNGLNSVLVWKCKEKNCNFQARFRANLEFHHLDHKISKPLHQCRNCSMSFEKKRCYKEHMDSYCVKLAKTFAVNSCLSLREEVHALAKTYNFLKCPQFERCAFVCNNHEQLRLHKAESHCRPDQINFDCRLCGLGFADQQAYYEHEALFCWSGLEMEEEDGKLFSCKHESCEFQSFSKAEEITHIATHCPGGIFTNFKCRFCGFCFTSEKVVGEHEMYFCGNNV